MLQRYKLRLGDGTVLGVDHAGLKTWAVDGQAMVQAAASRRWYPLKAFLAAERAAAKRAARLRAKGAGAPSVGPARPLPLVYPAPREPKASPLAAPAPAEPPPLIALSPEIQVLAEPPASSSRKRGHLRSSRGTPRRPDHGAFRPSRIWNRSTCNPWRESRSRPPRWHPWP